MTKLRATTVRSEQEVMAAIAESVSVIVPVSSFGIEDEMQLMRGNKGRLALKWDHFSRPETVRDVAGQLQTDTTKVERSHEPLLRTAYCS